MKCMSPECGQEDILARGLCKKCYDRLNKQVQRGTATWGALIEQGLASRALHHGRPRKNSQAFPKDHTVKTVAEAYQRGRLDPSSVYYDPDGDNPRWQFARIFLEENT